MDAQAFFRAHFCRKYSIVCNIHFHHINRPLDPHYDSIFHDHPDH